MRRRVVATALSAVLVAVSGCSDDPVGAGVDKASACATLKQAIDDGGARFADLESTVAQATSDPARTQAALADLAKIIKDFEAAYGARADDIADPELRAAVHDDLILLAQMSTQVDDAGGDLPKAVSALRAPRFEQAGTRVKQLCGLE